MHVGTRSANIDKNGRDSLWIETKCRRVEGPRKESELFEVTVYIAGRKCRNPQERRRKIRGWHLEHHGENKQSLTLVKH